MSRDNVSYDTLANEHFVSLENVRTGWKITYWRDWPKCELGQDCIVSKSFDTLISDWEERLSELELAALTGKDWEKS